MIKDPDKLVTFLRRPIDCQPKYLKAFADLVVSRGEVPIENLQQGLRSADMLFFTTYERNLVGVSAARYTKLNYQRNFYKLAGVPEMFNPHALEICWLAVRKDCQGKGVWQHNRAYRKDHLTNRPYFAIHRLKNDRLISGMTTGEDYPITGKPFRFTPDGENIALMTWNHDPVFEPNKKLRYQTVDPSPKFPPYGSPQ